MLQRTELFSLARELAHTKVLTVYVDGRVTNPPARDVWRASLKTAVRSARRDVADADERARFDRAVKLLTSVLPPPTAAWSSPAWGAFVTEDRVVFHGALPARLETAATWRDGPAIAPFLQALKQLRPVLLAIVDSESAKLLRYASGELHALDTLRVTPHDSADPAPGDTVQRRKRAAFDRMVATLASQMTDAAGLDGILLIGGSPEWAQRARIAIARRRKRVDLAFDLPSDSETALIVRAAKRAARRARAEEARKHLGVVMAQVGRRSTLGLPATRLALDLKAVDSLLVSPRWIHKHRDDAEDLMRDALAQRAEIELVSSDTAAAVDRIAGGVAARLRYAAFAS
jgi:hypothetical protein